MNELKDACGKLPKNIKVDFRGMVSNQQVLEDYSKEEYHLFLNVSSSEGIPVAIMEAMSYGIPCIATNVGGNSEIVTDNYSGKLLAVDFEPQVLADYIKEFATMSAVEYNEYRKNAREDWKNKHSAIKNYTST